MNVHVPRSEFEELIRPEISGEMFARMATSEDVKAAATAIAALAFDEANREGRDAIESRDAEMTEQAALKSKIETLKKEQKKHAPAKTWAGREKIKPLSWITLCFIFISLVVALADPAISMYTAASYMASSGLVEGVTTLATALPFTFCYIGGLYALKSIADALSERGRIRFKIIVLSVGFTCVVAHAAIFALLFNPATTQTIDPNNIGGGALNGAQISFAAAAALIFLGIVVTMTLGAGVSLHVIDQLDKNKVWHVEPSKQFQELAKDIALLETQSAAIEKRIAQLNAYLNGYAKAREGFVWATVNKANGTHEHISALHKVAFQEIASKIAASHNPPEKGAKK